MTQTPTGIPQILLGSEVSPVAVATATVAPVLALDWRAPIIAITIEGSAAAPWPGLIGPHLGAMDSNFFQRRMQEADACRGLGCAPRVMFRGTFGHWQDHDPHWVAATGYDDCPAELRESWRDLLEQPRGYELIQYVRHGGATGGGPRQYSAIPRERAHQWQTNMVASCCNIDGQPVASLCIDGLPEVEVGSLDSAELNHTIALGVRLYSEAWPEQGTVTASLLWGDLPAMALWQNVRQNPPRRTSTPKGERIVIDVESTTAEQCAVFLRECAVRQWSPMIYQPHFERIGKTVKELQELAGRNG